MKKILFIILLLIGGMSIQAQTTYKKGADGKLISTSVGIVSTPSVKTSDVVTIKDTDYPVFKTARGKFYIVRISKNTGKEYKQYIKIE
jgi:hypothetical protein